MLVLVLLVLLLLLQLLPLRRVYQAKLPALGEESMERGDNRVNMECAICRDVMLNDLWTCGKCAQDIHRACLTDYLMCLRKQKCECALPGLCTCRPAPNCPLCRASVPACMTRGRQHGTPECTFNSGHGGLCSSEPPVVTDVHGRARRSLARHITY